MRSTTQLSFWGLRIWVPAGFLSRMSAAPLGPHPLLSTEQEPSALLWGVLEASVEGGFWRPEVMVSSRSSAGRKPPSKDMHTKPMCDRQNPETTSNLSPNREDAEQAQLSNKKEQTADTNDNLGGPQGCEESLSHTPYNSTYSTVQGQAAEMENRQQEEGPCGTERVCVLSALVATGICTCAGIAQICTHTSACTACPLCTAGAWDHAVFWLGPYMQSLPSWKVSPLDWWRRVQRIFALLSTMHVNLQVSQN